MPYAISLRMASVSSLYVAPDAAEPEGVNTRAELADAAAVLRARINEAHMLAGVTIVDPKTTWIEADVELEPDATIHPFTVLGGKTKVGAGAVVGPHAVAIDALIGPEATVGPFCYLRPGTVLEARAKAGTFVEIKNSHIGEGAKVPHLSYIGDADVGEGTNIAAGAITANYRPELGPGKFRTTSAATSIRPATMCSLLRSRLATMLGSRRARSSRRTSRPGPSRSLAADRSTRKDSMIETGTTELNQLPGMEGEGGSTGAVPRPEHFIERGPWKRLMLFSGRSHQELALKMAEQLGIELGEVELETFANGETYCRYVESIRGADAFIVQTGSEPVDRNIMELLFMIQAAKLASAKRITAVIPLFPYARQDRKAKPREPISARLIADCSSLPAPTAC